MTLTVGFSRPKGKLLPLFSWAVRLVECTPYSHVYIRWTSSHGVPVVYEASGTSVKFVNGNLHEQDVKTIDSFTFDISEQAKWNLVKFCLENAGSPYEVKQIVGILCVKIAKLFGRKIKNPFKSGRYTQVCSELVGYVLRDVLGKDLDLDLDTASPKDIYSYLEKQRNRSINSE